MCLLIKQAAPQQNIQELLDVLPSVCTVFVEIVAEEDAMVPVLDLARTGPAG